MDDIDSYRVNTDSVDLCSSSALKSFCAASNNKSKLMCRMMENNCRESKWDIDEPWYHPSLSPPDKAEAQKLLPAEPKGILSNDMMKELGMQELHDSRLGMEVCLTMESSLCPLVDPLCSDAKGTEVEVLCTDAKKACASGNTAEIDINGQLCFRASNTFCPLALKFCKDNMSSSPFCSELDTLCTKHK